MAAMRAAFFNPDRAVEYLLNGIPEGLQQQQAAAASAAAAPAPSAATAQPPQGGNEMDIDTPMASLGGATGGAAGGDEPINLFEAAANQAGAGGDAGAGLGGAGARSGGGAAAGAGAAGANLDFLRNNPQFQRLRSLVQQQPQMLEPILAQVGSGNPALAELIQRNPEQFLELLGEDEDEEGGAAGGLPPGTHAIPVTEAEREAIERLCRLGFSRDDVIQAYFACDKNEELAANFLFDQPDEGED
jgi:UV excision repair protein RAD23